MKNFTFLLLFTFCFATSYAQLGIRAGLNLANISGDTEDAGDALSSITGLQFGLTYNLALSDKVSIRPGALYSVKGYGLEVFDTEAKIKFNYLEIPVDIVFDVFDSEAFGIDVHAGPYLGYMLSAKGEANGMSEDIDFEDSDINRIDIGLNLGGTVNFSGVYVGLNYGLGLSNLNSGELEDSVKNTNLSIIAGYMFGGGSSDK